MQSLLRRAATDKRGSVAIIVAVAMIALCGIAAVVIDISYVYNVRRQLQNATDQSALAGAAQIYQNAGVSTANSYSATTGNKNVTSGVTVTMVSGYPQLKCLSSLGLPCAGTTPANAITVAQTATVPTFFGKIFGKSTVTITVQATAAAAGNTPKPYNIVMIIDTTGSMDTTDGVCNSLTGQSRISCAKIGGQELLKGMFPSMDKLALFTFPGVTSATKNMHYNCSGDDPTTVAYNASPAPVYEIISLASDYKSSDTTTTLSTSSNIVRAFGGGGSGCAQGMGTPGGQGTYIADVITAAQAHLAANDATGTQAVMVLLSDGDAGATSAKVGSAKYDDQCQQAVDAATAAKTSSLKTWIYAVAYSAPTTGGCSQDSPYISPCNTMKAIATDTGKFYASGGSCTSSVNNINDLKTIFARISSSLTSPRLVPDNTT